MTNKQLRNFAQMQFLTGKIKTAEDIKKLFLQCENSRQILTFAYLYSHFSGLSTKQVFSNLEYLATINYAIVFYENYDLIKAKIDSKV